ncbi:hypothetical protein [Oceanobacillus oncorhynchi]|uniref:hypothetical protein n=1 Tax=Oceanobacillus oncorhynchi TaxID=545501 RepID=UPI0018682E17|nr:hypothetical protein [Oceanobacillus oncorhynchi]
MSKKTWKIIGDIALAVLVAGAIAAMIFMNNEVADMRAEIERLQQENSELKIENMDLDIQLENITDAYWQLNNQLEKESD